MAADEPGTTGDEYRVGGHRRRALHDEHLADAAPGAHPARSSARSTREATGRAATGPTTRCRPSRGLGLLRVGWGRGGGFATSPPRTRGTRRSRARSPPVGGTHRGGLARPTRRARSGARAEGGHRSSRRGAGRRGPRPPPRRPPAHDARELGEGRDVVAAGAPGRLRATRPSITPSASGRSVALACIERGVGHASVARPGQPGVLRVDAGERRPGHAARRSPSRCPVAAARRRAAPGPAPRPAPRNAATAASRVSTSMGCSRLESSCSASRSADQPTASRARPGRRGRPRAAAPRRCRQPASKAGGRRARAEAAGRRAGSAERAAMRSAHDRG